MSITRPIAVVSILVEITQAAVQCSLSQKRKSFVTVGCWKRTVFAAVVRNGDLFRSAINRVSVPSHSAVQSTWAQSWAQSRAATYRYLSSASSTTCTEMRTCSCARRSSGAVGSSARNASTLSLMATHASYSEPYGRFFAAAWPLVMAAIGGA